MSLLRYILGKKEMDEALTSEEIETVQVSFEKIANFSKKATIIFYQYLHHLDPILYNTMRKEIGLDEERLFSLAQNLIHNLSNDREIVPTLHMIAKNSNSQLLKDSDYGTIGAALLFSIESLIGDDWNEFVKRSWVSAFTFIAINLKSRSNQAA
ncbi:MAG: hypothetical protein JXR07_02470 [Reichenbachiella sp.]